ncbi:MAG: response regulator [Acidobacteriota bacterium]
MDRSPRTLLIDPDPCVQRRAVKLLSESHRLELASTDATLWEQLDHRAPDLVLVAHRPPALDGLDLLRRLRGVRPDIARVALVPSKAVGLRDLALELGCDEIIDDRLDEMELRLILPRALMTSQRRLERVVYRKRVEQAANLGQELGERLRTLELQLDAHRLRARSNAELRAASSAVEAARALARVAEQVQPVMERELS